MSIQLANDMTYGILIGSENNFNKVLRYLNNRKELHSDKNNRFYNSFNGFSTVVELKQSVFSVKFDMNSKHSLKLGKKLIRDVLKIVEKNEVEDLSIGKTVNFSIFSSNIDKMLGFLENLGGMDKR